MINPIYYMLDEEEYKEIVKIDENPDLSTAEKFNEKMAYMMERSYTETRHRIMDEWLCEAITNLDPNYLRGVEIFRDTKKWYS